MMHRRGFLKDVMCTGISCLMPASFLSGLTSHAAERNTTVNPVVYEPPPKDRRIYYLADNMELYIKICRGILGLDCYIFSLNPYSADGMSLNGFIYVIDRNYVGRKWWDDYIRRCNEYSWKEPCLIIDSIKDLDIPQSNYVEKFDLDDKESVTSMIHSIKEACLQNILMNHCNHNKI